MKPTDWATPAKFRARLMIDAGGSLVQLGERLEPWQAADFEALDPAWRLVAGGRNLDRSKLRKRAYLERPRGHSKTSDLAVMVSWVLLASRRRLAGVAAAADRDQARLLRDAVAKLVSINPWLGDAIDVQAYRVANRHTGSELEIISSDAASSYGLTPDFVVCDELTHWKGPDLWHSLLSAAAKRDHCFLLIISNAGFGKGESWQWKVREAARLDPRWHFSRLDGPMASWISPADLDEQRRMLPDLVYRRLWGNEWTAGEGDAIREDDISAAIKLKGPVLAPERGWSYVAGVDLGLMRDASAVAVVGRHVGYTDYVEQSKPRLHSTLEAMADLGMVNVAGSDGASLAYHHAGTQRLRLASLTAWRPEGGQPVSVEKIETEIVALHERLGLACVAYDPHQARYLAERLQSRGIRTEAVDFTGPNLKAMATETLEAFTERKLELYPDGQLLSDLRALRVEEKAYGVRLTSPRGPAGHGDSATALSIALFASRRFASASRVHRPLIAWVP